MKLSVVIPALNEALRIGDTVRSVLRAAETQPEIIVVDGGSSDDTSQRAVEAGARVVASEPGRARQLGVGARASHGEVLLLLHADTTLPSAFDAAIGQALRDPTVVGGAFRFRFDQRTPALRVIEWGARLRSGWLRMPYGDQALFVRRETLEATGGIPQAPIMEDLDLVKAMKQRGSLAILTQDAVTSARRYVEHGAFRVALRHLLALGAWLVGVDRARLAAWYGR